MLVRRFNAAILAFAVALPIVGAVVPAGAAHTVTNETVISNAEDANPIAISIFQPETANATDRAPVILHSHGWGGSRASTITTEIGAFLDAGLGVVSIDQRGHGASGGEANVEDPDLEGFDIEAVVDRVAELAWVELDGANDPVIGAIGGSYGGGYQTIGALSEILHRGVTRFNALAPEITWYDLPESLAPQGVPRTVWTTLLYGTAPAHASYIDEGEALGLATGWFPDGTIPGTVNLKEIFYTHSPRWFADNGMQLPIPALIAQGATDNLFNLNQGIHNFQRVLTDGAQTKSIFVAYNKGHVLPEMLPLSSNPSGNPCFSDWNATRITFFKEAFEGKDPKDALGVPTYNMATNANLCLRTPSLGSTVTVPAGPLGTVATPTTGATLQLEIAQGPITISGIPHLRGNLTTGVDGRAFFGLAVGTNPADAQVVQNNVMPVRSLLPVVGQPLDIELPGITVAVPAGQNLYLTVAPQASMFLGTSSRVPGVVVVADAVVDLPVL